eukprot:CAMPEP_0180702640 /NCGR_PEP_ID=MMETSP1038_2-20121128/6223_1 /TAXON_ID=632150 /ORGANISM="Azadinium spinosum, Strain 3D9" /LENGTH=288 /DNA_ID=CAMNT_0022734405 /DNA_START=104 /DNA_END=969 /DNA_ORIENTATION=+
MASSGAASSNAVQEAPEQFCFEGKLWARTDICKGPDLVNGTYWMADFQRRCREATEARPSGAPGERRSRLLRQAASAGDEPQYWKHAGGALKPGAEQAAQGDGGQRPSGTGEACRSFSTGDEVMFWFNVGPMADKVSPPPVFVTSARCPHQGLCLSGGELKEIEDLAGHRKPVVRCPRHNRLWDVISGEGQGNSDTLRVYDARYFREHGRFYVAVKSALPDPEPAASPLLPGLAMPAAAEAAGLEDGGGEDMGEDAMEVDASEEPMAKRQRSEIATPARTLVPCRTMA